MNELALFAGAGGGILGGHLLGWRTRCAVELDAFCRSVLLRRQADGILPQFPVWDDVRTFDGRPWAGHIDVISAGFPCQDISSAGAGAGIDGERSGLWREVVRIAGEIRPRFMYLENSPLLVGRGLARVLGDIAGLGMHARWGTLGADDVGAPHIRKRMWVVAYADEDGCERADLSLQPGDKTKAVPSLVGVVKLLPTPAATDWKGQYTWETVKKRMEMTRGVRLPEELSRRVGKAITPNPEFWEWMMGWPIGSTALQPLAMDKFRQWRRLHGGF